MNTNLRKALREMSELDFHVLRLHMQIAELCRNIMTTYELTDDLMAEKLGLSANKFTQFKNCGYDYSMNDLANLQAIQMKLATERARFKIQAQVQFNKDTIGEQGRIKEQIKGLEEANILAEQAKGRKYKQGV